MSDLALVPITELIEELKLRDITFLIAYADHQQFTKRETDVVWALDRRGILPIQLALLHLLNEHMDDVVEHRMKPDGGDQA